MPDSPSDDGKFSPEDLKRLGLAGRGDLSLITRGLEGFPSRIKRGFEGLPEFLRALRPTWRGVLLTVLLCCGFNWLGHALLYALHPIDLPDQTGDLLDIGFGELFSMMYEGPFAQPLARLRGAMQSTWSIGAGAMAPPVALALALLLLRTAEGRVRRIWVGAITTAAAVSGIGWAVFAPDQPWSRDAVFTMLLPNCIVSFAGATVGAWLLYRATGVGAARVGLADAAPALALAALIGINLLALTQFPIAGFRCLFREPLAGNTLTPEMREFFEMVWAVTEYSVPVLGGLLLLVPAIIVTRAVEFRPALRILRRIAIRRPAALLVTCVGLVVILLLPIGALLNATFLAAGLVQALVPVNLLGSVLAALCYGLPAGLFIYATALAANALAVSLGSDPVRGQTPPGSRNAG